MDEGDRVTVTLPMSDELRRAVGDGEYETADAAVEAAVASWEAGRIIERIGPGRLRRHCEDAAARGDFLPLDLVALRGDLEREWDRPLDDG